MFAGPTDSLVIADHTASAGTVTWDLVSQAEPGIDSTAWLISTDRALATDVMTRAPAIIDSLPEPNRTASRTVWADCAEVILCENRLTGTPAINWVHATRIWNPILSKNKTWRSVCPR